MCRKENAQMCQLHTVYVRIDATLLYGPPYGSRRHVYLSCSCHRCIHRPLSFVVRRNWLRTGSIQHQNAEIFDSYCKLKKLPAAKKSSTLVAREVYQRSMITAKPFFHVAECL